MDSRRYFRRLVPTVSVAVLLGAALVCAPAHGADAAPGVQGGNETAAAPAPPEDAQAPSLSIKEAVRLALERNPMVQQADFETKAQQEDRTAAFRDRLGTLSADYTYRHMKDYPYMKANTPGFPNRLQIGDNDDAVWGVNARLPVFTGFALETKQALQSLGVDIRKYQAEGARLDVGAGAEKAYLGLLLAQRHLETAQQSVERLKAHLHVAQSLYDQGIVPYNDLLKAKVALAEVEQFRTAAAEGVATARVQLNLIIREPDPEKVFHVSAPLDNAEGRQPPGLPAAYGLALDKRPERAALAVAVRQAGLRARLQRSAYYPQVSLVGRYEQHGEDVLASKNDWGNENNIYGGVDVRWLLFDWGASHHKAAAEVEREHALSRELESVSDRIRLQVRKAWGDLKVARQNLDTARLAVDQAKEDLRITRLQYSQQIASATDVIDSETNLTRAENTYYETQYACRAAVVDLARACGVMTFEGVPR